MTDSPAADADQRLDRSIVGVVGAGVMGAGIAQVALEAGHEGVLHDVDEAALARGRDRIADGIARRAARAVPDPAAIHDWSSARMTRPYTLGALRLLENGSSSIEAIDRAMRDAGFPLGPFELMDLTGIDVTYAASTAIWERLGRPERLRPSPIQERLIESGQLGRK